jgi:hypothetical protein
MLGQSGECSDLQELRESYDGLLESREEMASQYRHLADQAEQLSMDYESLQDLYDDAVWCHALFPIASFRV